MSVRSSDSFRTELMHRLKRGDRETLRTWMADYVAKHPDNSYAADEYSRLKAGVPLRCELEEVAEREQKLRQIRESVLELLSIPKLPTTLYGLRRLVRELEEAQALLQGRLQESESRSLSELLHRTKRESKRRFRRRWYPVIGFLCFILSVSLTAWLLFEYSRQQEVESYRWQHVQKHQLNEVKSQAELEQILQNFEQKPGLLLVCSSEEKHALNAWVEQTDEKSRTRWKAVQQQARRLQEVELMQDEERQNTPQAIQPLGTGDIANNEEKVQTELNSLQQRVRERCASGLPTTEEEKQESVLQQKLRAIQSYRQLLAALPTAQNYGVYLDLILSAEPMGYPPAVECLSFRDKLPQKETLTDMIKLYNHRLTSAEEKALAQTLIEGKPSFNATFPAVAEQLLLLQDLSSNRALQTCLYRVETAQGETFVSEEAPSTAGGVLRLHRSRLDPTLRMEDDPNIHRDRVEAARMYICDPSPLLKATGLMRENAANEINLLEALSSVLHTEAKQCPALARAYVYDHLLSVITMPDRPAVTGMHFSPKLQRDADSFVALKHRLHIEPDGNCWLRAQDGRAEKAFAAWFRKREGHDYAAEAKANLADAQKVHPAYCGYISEKGEPILLRAVPKTKPLWYMRGGRMQLAEPGTKPQNATPLSPLFISTRL